MFSRLIAPYLAKTLGTTVIVENVPGAGGLVALNKLYLAPPDGLQISLSQGTMAGIAQLTGDQAARFDLAKFTYLATVGAPPGLWLVKPDSPIREVQQAIDAKMKWRWASAAERPASASARPSPARRSSSIATSCRDTRAAPTRALGHARRNGRGLRAGIVRQPFREVQAELGAGNDLAHQVAVLPGPADRVRGGEDRSRPNLGDGFPRQPGRARPPLDGAARHSAGAARLSQRRIKETLHDPQLIAEGERMERIVEYTDPASTHQNVVAVVNGVPPAQKARVLKLLSGEK